MNLSKRINEIEPSGTVRFTRLIQELRGQGSDVIDLAVGEPPYDTPEVVIEATRQALAEGRTKYGPVAGLPELKARLARQFDGYGEHNILVANGSKQCLYTAFQAICDPRDEVIIPRPCWVSFPQQVRLAGGCPVLVDTRNHQLDCQAIERAVTTRTRAILINSPNNPTGAVYPARDLAWIAELALQCNLYLIADEAYSSFVYDGCDAASLFDFEDIRNQLVVVRSFSKNQAMTGFRLGYLAAHREFVAAATALQSHLTGNVCTFAQHGALAALEMGDRDPESWRGDLERKRDYAYRRTTDLFTCVKPGGAFYLFPDIRQRLKSGMTSIEFAEHLLAHHEVAVVPGDVFGAAGHIRISFAVSGDRLASGFDRIAEAL